MKNPIFPFRSISIHALRGEGDAADFGATVRASSFQSTPSVGRATRFDCKEVLKLLKFQSTPSVGRATTSY
mgnify:CR=1 FL=1